MESMKKDAGNRKALGRGLAALIPPTSAPPSVVAPSMASNAAGSALRILPIERIRPNKTQPRKVFDEQPLQELADSIRAQGILQPIIVRKVGEQYEIVAGERRWRAASRAGLQEVPVLVKEFTDSQVLQAALIENIQRQDLDPLEEAEAYNRLIRDHEFTHEKLADSMGKSRSTITNSLRLLKLSDELLAMLADGRLTAGHARALMGLENDGMMTRLAQEIVGRKMSVREAEAKARLLSAAKRKTATKKESRSASEVSIEERLQRSLGTRVRLHHQNGKGHIEIHFDSLDALDGLLDKLIVN